MEEAGIGAITLPGANLFLQGRADKGLVRRGITRVKELRAMGVPVATASDNINDPFHPFGRGDLLQIGLLTAYAAHMAGRDDLSAILDMISTIPAGFYGIENHGLKEGASAQFVLADTGNIYDLFSFQSPTRFVYAHGQWLSERRSSSCFHDAQLKALWSRVQTSADLRCDHV
ncbi:amidohydrolase family protein [Terrilactibacillus sp. S3-3]|nr:amidohydrolase family protein [Terrilactibacillus sp. S3-3]